MTVGQSRRRVRLKCDETVSTTRSTNFETSCPYQPLPGEILTSSLILILLLIIILIISMIITIMKAFLFYLPRMIWLSMEGGLMAFLCDGCSGSTSLST